MFTNTMSWDNWRLIQVWLEKAVSALKSKISAPSTGEPAIKKSRPNEEPAPGGQRPAVQKTHLVGLSIEWMKAQQLCIRFQTGTCNHSDTHKTQSGDFTLLHNCGGCQKLGKATDKTPSAKNCPHKSQFFQ